MFTIHNCHMINLPVIKDHRGNLTFIEEGNSLPFKIERIYYLYDVPFDSERGGHAHKDLYQLVIPLSGSFEMLLDDSRETISYNMKNPSEGLLLTPMIWREMKNFTSGAICLVLASEKYSEDDYIRNYLDFKKEALDRYGN